MPEEVPAYDFIDISSITVSAMAALWLAFDQVKHLTSVTNAS
jgi:hypothetical protein